MNTSSTIHVVDDSGEARRALQRLLESAGLAVKAYASAQEFLNDYDRSRPGCLLLDLRMPASAAWSFRRNSLGTEFAFR